MTEETKTGITRDEIVQGNPMYQIMASIKHQVDSLISTMDQNSECSYARGCAVYLRHATVDLDKSMDYLATHIDNQIDDKTVETTTKTKNQ